MVFIYGFKLIDVYLNIQIQNLSQQLFYNYKFYLILHTLLLFLYSTQFFAIQVHKVVACCVRDELSLFLTGDFLNKINNEFC